MPKLKEIIGRIVAHRLLAAACFVALVLPPAAAYAASTNYVQNATFY